MKDSCEFSAEITEKNVAAFSALTGDFNPLHNDAAYAAKTEFGRPISHGALLAGLVSRVLGMHIPGERSLILGMKLQYPKPLFYPAKVLVRGALKHYSPERNFGAVGVTIVDQAKGWPVLEAEVNFSLHAMKDAAPASAPKPSAPAPNGAKSGAEKILVLGGTGGLGAALLPRLTRSAPVVCLTRRERANEGSLSYARVDVEDDAALEKFLSENPASGFSAAVHLSAPPPTRAFLSDDLEAVRRHLRQSAELPVRLAHWARQSGSRVRRIVLVGSSYGTRFPKPHLGAYSLGKAAMEQACRLLVADLSAVGATINVVAPAVVPAGMNEGMPERAKVSLASRMPTKRLVSEGDVAGVIEFLLSPASAQINGAVIAVDGGLAD